MPIFKLVAGPGTPPTTPVAGIGMIAIVWFTIECGVLDPPFWELWAALPFWDGSAVARYHNKFHKQKIQIDSDITELKIPRT